MLKKTVTYEDFDGNKRTEQIYFNLSKAELIEMQNTTAGGLDNLLQRMIDAQENVEIFKAFKSILLRAYGEKSDDGKRFMKLDKEGNRLSVAFEQSAAYDALMTSLLTDQNEMSAFVNGIVPADLAAAVAARG